MMNGNLYHTVTLTSVELGSTKQAINFLQDTSNVKDRKQLISIISTQVRQHARLYDKPVPTGFTLVSIEQQHWCETQDTIFCFNFQRKNQL